MAGLSKENPLKNVFNEKVVKDLAERIEENYSHFEKEKFIFETTSKFQTLGFLERSKHIRDMLYKFLPKDFSKAVIIMIKSLGKELDDDKVATLDDFIIMPQCDYVSSYGINYTELSLKALYEMTKRFSAEGNIRTFLESDYDKTIKALQKWCEDPNPHVRRLVSEGTRPRLPLAGRIKIFQKNPKPVIELLDKLKADNSLYVRRSVANNINDIAKDNPEIAIETLKKWSEIRDKNVNWVIRHASRSLLKEGNNSVLNLLGYKTDIDIIASQITLNKAEYSVGEKINLTFAITLKEKKSEKLMIDYLVDYVKANDKNSEKVFKMRDIKLDPNQTINIEKTHWLKDTSGRKHYSGQHSITLQINGKLFSKVFFIVK